MTRDEFERYFGNFPDALLLVSSGGAVEAANGAGRELLATAGWTAEPGLLLLSAADNAVKLEAYLRTCARTREFLPGSVVLSGPSGRRVACRADAAALGRDLAGAPNVLLRLRPKTEAITPIAALNDKLEQLTREIAVRRRTEEKLDEQRNWLQTMLSSIGDGVIATGGEGRIAFMNGVAEELTGWPLEEARGKEVAEVFPIVAEGSRQELVNPVRLVLDSGAAAGISPGAVLMARNGREVMVDHSAAPIRDSTGAVIGVILVFRDVTEARQTDERLREAQRLESLGLLAGGIAHDFNNLLTGVMGNASLALDVVPADSPVRHMLEQILMASDRAAHLTRQMLAYSGRGRFLLARINLTQAVRDILPLLRMSLPKKVDVRLDLADDLPVIEADPGQVQQLLMNLIINAGEAIGPDTPGLIVISTRVEHLDYSARRRWFPVESAEADSYVALEVRDTGCGMDESTRARMFDPFFTTKFTGRGLGLSAVLGIVRSHNGIVDVDSAPGRGTTFRILLPSPGSRVPAREVRTMPDTRRAVLVADDEDIVREAARNALERRGYRVLLARNGREAVEVLRANPDVCLVVLDMTMPVMSGPEALERIQSMRPGLPAIVVSGYAQTDVLRHFAGFEVASFLQKPFRATELADAAAAAIAARVARAS